MNQPDRVTRRDVAFAVTATMVAFIAYGVTTGFEFVWDDNHVLAAHPEFTSLANWREIITSTWWLDALYRPFTQLSLAVDWAISDGNPHFFHAVNVVLNGVVTAAVFVLARCWLGSLGAFATALVFAVHPVHVEAVASVVGRAEIFVGLFAVLAALAYRWDGILAERNDASGKRAAASFGTLLALFFALASKESAFAVPGILLIVDWLESRRTGEQFSTRVRRHWILLAASLALALEWLMLRTLILGDVAGDHPAAGLWGEGMGGRTLIMAPLVFEYLRLMLFPLRLSADYSPDFVPANPAVTVKGVLGIGVVIGLSVWAFVVRAKTPVVTFALAWIGGTLLVVANIIVPTGVLLAERTVYLPSVGLALLAGWAVQRWHARSPRAAIAVLVAVSALLFSRTLARVPVWRDSATFLPQLVLDAPGSFRSYWLAGTLAYEAGNKEEGVGLVRQALTVYPLWLGTWRDLGDMLMREERWAEAADAYSAAFRLEPTGVEYAARAINGYALAGKLDSAQAVAERAAQVDAHHPLLLSARGTLASQAGRKLEAMTWRRQAAWRAPNDPGHWYVTAHSALQAGYCREVERSIQRLRSLEHPKGQVDGLVARAAEIGCAV